MESGTFLQASFEARTYTRGKPCGPMPECVMSSGAPDELLRIECIGARGGADNTLTPPSVKASMT